MPPPRASAYASSIEQHAAVGPVEGLPHPDGGLADEAGDELRAVGLDQVALLDHAEGPVDLREQPGHGRLAGARVAGEHEVAALVGHRQVALAPQVLHPDEVGDQLHLGLHAGQADEVVELGHQLLERAGRRQLGLGRRGRAAGPPVAVASGTPGFGSSPDGAPARRSVARNRSIARSSASDVYGSMAATAKAIAMARSW